MKNVFKVLGNLNRARMASNQRFAVPLLIIALVAVIGFFIVGCDVLEKEEPFSFDGTWDNYYNVGNQFVFSGDNFIYKHHDGNYHTKGTFTYSDTHITFTCTHRENGDGEWYVYTGSLTSSNVINNVSKYTLRREDSADYLDLGNTIGECFSRKKK